MIQTRNLFNSHNVITFTCYIQGNKFNRLQVLPPNYKEQYPLLKEGQWYEVECWVENAQRAIIHLDKPLNVVK